MMVRGPTISPNVPKPLGRLPLADDAVHLSSPGTLGHVLRKQHLVPDEVAPGLVEVVGDLVGLHATRPTTPALSLFARLPDFRREALEDALYEARTLVRLKCIRQTVFIVPRQTVAVLLAATRRAMDANFRRYLASRGVSVEACEQLAPRIVEALRGRELTVAELRATLGATGDVASAVGLLCDRGVLVRTRPARGWWDATNRYAVMDEWLPEVGPDTVPEQEAITQLVRAYLVAYGPASERDVAWWAGLPLTSLRAALATLAPEIVHVEVSGLDGAYMMLRSDVPTSQGAAVDDGTPLAFLPVLDPYVMGYKERDRYVDPAVADHVFDRGGNGTATIVLDGRVIGVWDAVERPSPTVRVHFFVAGDDDLLACVDDRARHVGRFLFGAEVRVQRVAEMYPLTNRPTGAYAPFEAAKGVSPL